MRDEHHTDHCRALNKATFWIIRGTWVVGLVLFIAGLAAYEYAAPATLSYRTDVTGLTPLAPVTFGQPIEVSCIAPTRTPVLSNPTLMLQNSTGKQLFQPIACVSKWTKLTYTPNITGDLFGNISGTATVEVRVTQHPWREFSNLLWATSAVVLAIAASPAAFRRQVSDSST